MTGPAECWILACGILLPLPLLPLPLSFANERTPIFSHFVCPGHDREREREKEKERECDLSPNLSTAKWPLLLQALCQVVYLKALKRPSKLLLFLRAKLGRGKGGQHHILTALANSSSCPTKKNVVHPCRREREREWLTDSVTLEKVFVNFFKWTWRFPILYLPTLWGIERLLVRQTRVVDGLVPVVQTSI